MRVRRQYNQWVANQTFEDYSLRFTARSARRWSHGRVANTALGSISFLALEAIGGWTTINCGFTNAVAAILVVSLLIFVTSASIAYHAARHGIDVDLLTRGGGFGYVGSTVSSLIYAIFTFIFFAIEGAILAVALEVGLGIPLAVGYILAAVIIVPLVTYGNTMISRLQLWTQPVWTVLQLLPFLAIAILAPHTFRDWAAYAGLDGTARGLQLALFGTAASVVFSLMGQIGEQVDFLRFMPEKRPGFDWRWWSAVMTGGPGWIVVGAAKMLAGSLLAVIALEQGVAPHAASQPVTMYLVGFGYLFGSPTLLLVVTVSFVVLSQIKINVTNAYAGSIAWSNFFARLTHSHPGRVVWLVFNVSIALLLMELGVYRTFDRMLAIYSNLAVSWIGALVADLLLIKPLGLSPPGIEFKRAHLPDINPVGVGAMTLATVVSLAAFSGELGETAEALSGFIGLGLAFVAAPVIAVLTRGRYYLARPAEPVDMARPTLRCCICEYTFEGEDMALCPAYDGPICSLCCTLDARCGDRCKPGTLPAEPIAPAAEAPLGAIDLLRGRLNRYAMVFFWLALLVAGVMAFVFMQGSIDFADNMPAVRAMAWNAFWLLIIVGGISAWMIVLAQDSRRLAQEESERQTALLMEEIRAHERTDAALQTTNVALQHAKEVAEAANLAKSRYMIGISHELRSPLNAVLGYAQILDNDPTIPARRRSALRVVRRSAEHMSSLIEGLMDISKIESGRLYLQREELNLPELLEQMVDMFRLQASTKGVAFHVDLASNLPQAVHGDGKRLRQILINLLSNAVKFTEHGHVALRVRYRSMFADIEVADTGSGIHPDEQERIFEPFERGRHAGAQSVSGTGLGLTITKLLISVMGGQIGLDSAPGRGSTFKVRLLLSEVLQPTSSLTTYARIRGYHGPRLNVLVADDDLAHCAIIDEILAPIGFAVESVHNGADCLLVASQRSVDLVLLDISMPGVSGWDVASNLRDHISPATRIVVLSGNAFEIEARRGKNNSYDAALTKPVDVNALLKTLSNVLRIEWQVSRPTEPDAAEPDPDPSSHVAAVTAVPRIADLIDLRQLGEIGYVRGIKDKIAEIDAQSPDHRWLTELLEPMVEKLDLGRFMATLTGLIEAGGR